jgi:hypothetical protein
MLVTLGYTPVLHGPMNIKLLRFISGKFRKYDYGLQDNALLYNQSEPSEYVLDTISSPVAIFCGDSDPFTDAQVTLSINVLSLTMQSAVQAKQYGMAKILNWIFKTWNGRYGLH